MANLRFQKTFVFDPSTQLVTSNAVGSQSLTNGQVGFFGPDKLGTGATPTPTTKKYIKIHQNVGDNKFGSVRTQPIHADKVIRYYGKEAKDPVAQVITIGYNGTTGTLPDLAEGEQIRVSINVFSNKIRRYYGNVGYRRTIVIAANCGSKTAEEVAAEIIAQVNNLNPKPGDYPTNFELVNFIIASQVTDGTAAEFDANVTVVNGSSTINFAGGDTTYGGGATALVVGDTITLRGSTYTVTSVAAGVVGISQPYVGVSETINVGATVNAAARLTAIGNVGVRLTTIIPVRPAYVAYDPTAPFDTEIPTIAIAGMYGAVEDIDSIYYTNLCDSLLITQITAPVSGNGYADEVRALEAESQGFDRLHTVGHMWDQRAQKPGYIFKSVDGVKYDFYYIQFEFSHQATQNGASPNTISEPYEVVFAVPTGTGANLEGVLNSYLVPMGFTGVVLGSDIEGDIEENENA